jgi:hypothetical protein
LALYRAQAATTRIVGSTLDLMWAEQKDALGQGFRQEVPDVSEVDAAHQLPSYATCSIYVVREWARSIRPNDIAELTQDGFQKASIVALCDPSTPIREYGTSGRAVGMSGKRCDVVFLVGFVAGVTGRMRVQAPQIQIECLADRLPVEPLRRNVVLVPALIATDDLPA